MRILHFIDRLDFRLGGPSRAIIDLCEAMVALGHRTVTLSPDAPDMPSTWRDASGGARGVVLPGPRGRRLGPRAIELLAAEVERSDVVHLHGVWELANLQVASMARAAGVPYVISLRGMLDDWCMRHGWLKKRLFWLLFARRMLGNAAAIHCTAGRELAQSKRWFPERLGRVIPNLMDLEPFRVLPDREAARLRWDMDGEAGGHLLFLSRLSEKKGLHILIEAAAMLREQGVPVTVHVAGTGDMKYERRCRDLARELSVDDRVRFLGHVGGVDKLFLFAAADLLVIPSSQENFGFVFFEALAAGLPVLTTDLVDTSGEILESGGGLIVGQDPRQFALACREALANGPALRQRGESGRAWMFRQLDPSVVARHFGALYAEISGHDTRKGND